MNRKLTSGVWLNGAEMDTLVATLAGTAVTSGASPDRELEGASGRERDRELGREFERRLADCPTLAYRVALGVLRNPAEAEDVAQEAMLRAYRNFHRLRERDAFRAWLVRTSWRLALDRIRSAGRRERREQAAVAHYSEAPVEDVAASREFERQLAAALDALPEKLRLVMVMAAIEGYNTREVAKLLDIPEGTVKSRLHLARKQLSESLRGFRVEAQGCRASSAPMKKPCEKGQQF